ncbi:MAG: HAD-IA family hydrolase [Micrococcales bacterium]
MKFFASALLFDNDGVLVDSHAAAVAAWNQWASEYAPQLEWDRPENFGVRAEDMVRKWIATPDLFDEANNRINQLEQDSAYETVPIAGAVELTSTLADGTWTVVTSANVNLGRARLLAAGHRVPAELVTGDDVSRGKPDPEPYVLGASRLGFDPVDCVVFEDAVAGAQAAADAGVGLIVGVGEKALEGLADVVVRDLSGITFDGEVLTIPDKNRLR